MEEYKKMQLDALQTMVNLFGYNYLSEEQADLYDRLYNELENK